MLIFLNTYFSPQQLIPLFPALTLVLAALVVFEFSQKHRLAIVLLVLGAFGLRIFASLLTSSLFLWDEQYHALIAKNMMEHPFIPMLYTDPLLPFDFRNWDGNVIWLHKQPLFLWQIAISFKVFGVNEWALRLPSCIMSAMMTGMIYRMGSLLMNRKTGFYAALLQATAVFAIELAAGRHNTDHNDIAFAFYVTASFWAWTESRFSGKKRWIILTGIFSGMAVLNKWLPGLIVFGGWFVYILADQDLRINLKEYGRMLLSLVISVLVFLPWQIYIFSRFPQESRYEFQQNTIHLLHPVEGHSGNFLFHFQQLEFLYGNPFNFLIILSVITFLVTLKDRRMKMAFMAMVLAAYLFFSLIATKMPVYPYFVSSIVYLMLGSLVHWTFRIIQLNKEIVKKEIFRKVFQLILLILMVMLNLNIELIQYQHTAWKKPAEDYDMARERNMQLYKKLPALLGEGPMVILNTWEFDHIPLMFYTDYVAYHRIPSRAELNVIKSKGYRIAVFDDGNLQEDILDDTEIAKIKSVVWLYPTITEPEVYY